MTVNLVQWRVVCGMFNCRSSAVTRKVCNLKQNFLSLIRILFLCWHYFENTFIFFLTLVYLFTFLQCHGDIELNPGPRRLKSNRLSVCHWNLNSLSAHNFSKLTQLKAYNSIYKYDFICLSETYLDSTTPDIEIEIDGYKLVRGDHPDNIKRGGVCIYYKESLPVREIKTPYLKEALLLEMDYNNKKVMVSVIYRSPSQTKNEFESFLSNFQKILNEVNNNKPSLSVITGDFNSRCSSWWSNDTDTSEGLKLFSLTSSNGFSQLINDPTHIQGNSLSCIDLIFTGQQNLSVNSGVHASLHPNCHHQIVHSSFNLNIYYPPPYQRLIWDYKKADPLKITSALDSVNWKKLFDKKDITAQVTALNETILNVFRNYVPNKYITIDDRDPVWMNELIKSKIEKKNMLYKQYIQNGRFESDFDLVKNLITEVNELVSSAKTLYYENLAKKLNNPLLQPKTYWSILKTFYNDKKIPLIPPLLIKDKFVTDIKTKADIFNNFFAEQCTPLQNDSKLPPNLMFLTQSRLDSLDLNEDEILKIIRALNIHKAHGHDDISIRMIKICDKSLLKPLILLFENSIKSSCYPDIWKRSNIIPVHKKNDKQLVNNYRPISLLPIFGKIFEKIIFNKIYNFLLEEKLLNPNQSGFRPSDSCINQLLAITHEIFEAFDCNPPLEVRSVFLDISKAFDKVWHEGLLYKLKSMGISGELYSLLENYLSGRLQRVVLNGQTSTWRPILAGVPQGSILGPLLFLIYINDLPDGLKSNAKLFADDTSLFTVVKDKSDSANTLNNDLFLISKWAYNWKMLFNPDPSKPAQEVLFSRKKQIQVHPTISLNNVQVEKVAHQKHLGIILDEKLNFKKHIDSIISKVNKGISVIKKLKYTLPRKSLIVIYKSFIRPLIDYGDIIYDQPQNEAFCEKLETLQYQAALAITGAIQGTSRDKIYHELGLESLKSRRWYKRLTCMYKIMKKEAPNYLINLIPKSQHAIRTRNNHIPTYHCRTDCFKYSFFPSTLNDWFKLEESIRDSESISVFKNKLLSLIRPVGKDIFNILDPNGIKFLTRLRLGLSHLNEHRFRHNFKECVNPLCSCSLEVEDTLHYLLHCHHFELFRVDLMNSVNTISDKFDSLSQNDKKDVLLYGDPYLDGNKNKLILEATITYIKRSERFSGSLFE